MTVDVPAALAAGGIGGLLMTLMRLGLRGVGFPLRLHVLRLWGEMLGAHRMAAEVLGLGVHLAGSAAIGLIYVAASALIGLGALSWRGACWPAWSIGRWPASSWPLCPSSRRPCPQRTALGRS